MYFMYVNIFFLNLKCNGENRVTEIKKCFRKKNNNILDVEKCLIIKIGKLAAKKI